MTLEVEAIRRGGPGRRGRRSSPTAIAATARPSRCCRRRTRSADAAGAEIESALAGPTAPPAWRGSATAAWPATCSARRASRIHLGSERLGRARRPRRRRAGGRPRPLRRRRAGWVDDGAHPALRLRPGERRRARRRLVSALVRPAAGARASARSTPAPAGPTASATRSRATSTPSSSWSRCSRGAGRAPAFAVRLVSPTTPTSSAPRSRRRSRATTWRSRRRVRGPDRRELRALPRRDVVGRRQPGTSAGPAATSPGRRRCRRSAEPAPASR